MRAFVSVLQVVFVSLCITCVYICWTYLLWTGSELQKYVGLLTEDSDCVGLCFVFLGPRVYSLGCLF